MSILSFKKVSFRVADKEIIKDLTFQVEQGDFISIIGPSGGGKSTILKLASFLISPSQGEISYLDKDLKQLDPVELRKTISYCFQMPQLFGKRVQENIDFPYSIRNEKYDHNRVEELFKLFKMDTALLDYDVKKLSGGEKQRIALIRQLLFEPKILLLDEVTSALDVKNKEIVEDVIKALHDKGITILWITHDRSQSHKFANKVMTIVDGQLESMEEI
ncbi:ABC transporter ATP-binding protein [Streptococcus catagoni]|uniref:ABC transporter ATP-binding protein n=1 Tax=Streptococcus catagoni TaxID=2654874 RepID=UPI00140B09DA|nr:ATP-binding cassette domain-containing protein [Streptococcus catagoni]